MPNSVVVLLEKKNLIKNFDFGARFSRKESGGEDLFEESTWLWSFGETKLSDFYHRGKQQRVGLACWF